MKKIKVSIAFKKYKGGFCPTPMKMRGAFAKGGVVSGGGGGAFVRGALLSVPQFGKGLIWQRADFSMILLEGLFYL